MALYPASFETSVRAARKQRNQDRQVPRREQPLVGLISGRGRTCDEAQPAALGEVVQMLDANPCVVYGLCIGEELLARFDGYHGTSPLTLWSHAKSSQMMQRSRLP